MSYNLVWATEKPGLAFLAARFHGICTSILLSSVFIFAFCGVNFGKATQEPSLDSLIPKFDGILV